MIDGGGHLVAEGSSGGMGVTATAAGPGTAMDGWRWGNIRTPPHPGAMNVKVATLAVRTVGVLWAWGGERSFNNENGRMGE